MLSVSIEDENFVETVKKNEYQFGVTDTFKVRLPTVQKITGKGLVSEYVIEEVLKRKKGSQQIELDFDND